MAKTKAYLRSKGLFPGIDGVVENAVKNCESCQLLTPKLHAMEPLKLSKSRENARENLYMDFCGPLPSWEYLFVIINEPSRYTVVDVVRSVAAKTVISSHMEHMGIIHRIITPRWPLANAQTESFHKQFMKSFILH